MLRSIVTVMALALLVMGCWAQTPPPPDTLKVNYFSNANTAGAPDGTVRITNPGTSGGNICALVYVMNYDQQMAECCGCMLTPDGLRTLSINADLTSNALTGVTLNNGDIKIVASTGAPTCDPRKPVPTATVRAWATHVQMPAGFPPSLTETEFSDATLSGSELTRLTNLCRSIVANGSGHGVCSCGVGD